MATYTGPLKPGEYSTNSQHGVDVGLTTNIAGGDYRMYQVNTVAIAAAAGGVVQKLYSSGVPTGKIQACATANSYDVAGGIPQASAVPGFAAVGGPNSISSTTTVPAGAYLLIQYAGPGVVQVNTTIVAPAIFASSATSLVAASVDSTTGAFGGISGRVTNTAVATVAATPTTCIWGLSA